ncbi:MAG: ABC transporter permease [Micrococcales bacterium]|nr:ABC transporter permease [Micrococcales bacterium]
MLVALDQGMIFALLALGVFLTYRILNMPDLTVDGSFTTGGGMAAILLTHGVHPVAATLAAAGAGALAGFVTATLHTRLRIEPLLASILTMIALWSINLRIMGKANLSMAGLDTLFSGLKEHKLLKTWVSVLILATLAILAKLLIDWFLATDFGLAVQSTGDNPAMAASLGINTNTTKTVTLMISNALVGLAGGIQAQYQGFADISMGVGLILVGLASVIVGNAILGTRYMFLASLGVIVGSVVYRLVIYFALRWKVLDTGDMKLISAVLVVIALVVSQSPRVRTFFQRLSPYRAKEAPEPLLHIPKGGGEH